jgi:hypothetical protein
MYCYSNLTSPSFCVFQQEQDHPSSPRSAQFLPHPVSMQKSEQDGPNQVGHEVYGLFASAGPIHLLNASQHSQPTLNEPDVPAQQQHQQHQQNEKTRLGTRERNIMYPMWLRCCSTTTSTCDVHIGIAHDKRDDIVHFAQRPTKFYLADAQQTLDGRTVTKISYQQQQQ